MTSQIKQKPIVLLGLAVLMLAFVTLWSYGQLHKTHAMATTAADDLAACRQLASKIVSLDNRPIMAHSQQIHLNELTRHIEQSTKNAKIAPGSLVRIWPDPPVRVGDTPYQKKSTQVLFRQITLRQIITFLHHVATQDGGPRATHIRLLAPRSNAVGSRWTVETALTYLIYAPKINIPK